MEQAAAKYFIITALFSIAIINGWYYNEVTIPKGGLNHGIL
ncbi:MAG: hypothetical protein NWE95_08785 [Candidatus Bathyarchaeota archaeon]|jgi:hypothetical protein|nr:hypothetical protein [Candidatus Bathyarchaeota archaeon]